MKVRKKVDKEISVPSAVASNKCIGQKIFPSVVKLGRVLPLLKKGDNNKGGNYRPISILPAASKIFEQIVVTRLVGYLENSRYLANEQHGYRKGRFTVSGTMEIANEIYSSFDEGMRVGLALLDLSSDALGRHY